MSKLLQMARLLLSTTSRQVMVALGPILVAIIIFAEEADKEMTFEVENAGATDLSLESHTVAMA